MQRIEIKCRGADSLPIDTIKDFQGKLKHITRDNLERLKVSILKNGFVAPIFIWRNEGECLALDGHQRIKALLSMREEGFDIPLLPVAYIEADNEDDARQKLLAITSQYGEFDIDELNSWVSNLDADIAETLRFVDDKIELDIEEIETEGDDEFEDEIEPITQLGDLWELGYHRVLCGDNTIDRDRLIDCKIDLLFTDPPYGISVVPKSGRIGWDTKNAKTTKFKPIISDDIEINPNLLINVGNNTIIFGGNYFCHQLPKGGRWLVWDKKFTENESQFVPFSACELMWTDFDGVSIKIYRCRSMGYSREGENEKRIHPTQKPIKLLSDIINDFTREDNIIYDPYIGSGSTLIACEKTNRICYGMELDPHYCDVIVKRYMDWCIKNEREYIIKLNGEAWQ